MEPSALSFTYVIGAVALERGVTDGERTVLNVDGATIILMKELYAMSHHAPGHARSVRRFLSHTQCSKIDSQNRRCYY